MIGSCPTSLLLLRVKTGLEELDDALLLDTHNEGAAVARWKRNDEINKLLRKRQSTK